MFGPPPCPDGILLTRPTPARAAHIPRGLRRRALSQPSAAERACDCRRNEMSRRAAAVVLALACNPALVSAQDTVLTVTAPAADVYKGPTTVTPVIGRAPRGAVLPVARNLGSWAKVAWPDAPDGVGYVHLTMGRLASAKGGPPATHAAARTAADPGPAATAPSAPAARR